jgi:hypothetical protein
MKKIIFFVFIIAFATITLMAQRTDELTEALDSLVITDIDYGFVRAKFNYGYDSNKRLNQVIFSKVDEYSTDLHYYEKQNYTYDDYGRCLSYTHFIWENGWIVDRKTDSTFNAMGECVFLRNYSYSSYFSNYEKREYTYENGNCTERRIYDAHSADTLWEPYNRLTWEYDDLGNCLQQIDYLPDGNEWKPYSKMVYTYNNLHQLVFKEYFLWNANTGAWDSEGTTTEYEYNADGFLLREYYISSNNIEKEAKYIYDERNNPIWYYFCQTTLPDFIWEQDTIEFAYNEHDSLVWKLENFTHHNGAIDHPVLYEYERDEQDRIVAETCFDNWASGQQPRFRNENAYDEQGRIVIKRRMNYSMIDGALLSDSHVEYEFDDQGNLVSEWEDLQNYDFQNYSEFYFKQSFDYNTPSNNILGLDRAWNDFIGFMTDHEFRMILEYEPYYWKNDHFPIHHKWESGTWKFSDPDLPDIISPVNADVALYYSNHLYSLSEAPEFPARVFNIEGDLAVECEAPVNIVVYDMLGRIVAQKRQATHSEFYLKSGVYVVKVGERAIKAVVK